MPPACSAAVVPEPFRSRWVISDLGVAAPFVTIQRAADVALVIVGAGTELTTIRIVISGARSAALFDFIGKDGGRTSRPYRPLTQTATRGAIEFFVQSSDGIAAGSWIRLAAAKAAAGSTMRERYSWPESHVI